MQIFPKHFGSLRSEQLNSLINLLARFDRIKFLNNGELLSYFEYLPIQLSMSLHYILYVLNSKIGNLLSFCDIISKHMYPLA